MIDRKASKDLEAHPFNGDILHYKEWHDLMRDHLLGSHQGYGRVLFEIERSQEPLTMDFIMRNPYIAGMNVDMTWITKSMWTFMVRHATKSARNTFHTLVDGEELNGAELWRVLYVNNEGGANEVEVADLGALHSFPACPNGASLPQYLGLWEKLRREHGAGLPEDHLKPMLPKMLPDSTASGVRKKCRAPDGRPPTTDQIIASPRADYHRLTDDSGAAA